MLNEQRRIPEEQEYFIRVIFWKFLSSSVFLPLSWWKFRMLQQFCLCVWMCVWKKTAHAEQRQFKVTTKWQAGSSGLLNCIVFFLFLLGGEKKRKTQLGQKASSLVSGELLSTQTKIAVIFCWQALFNVRVFLWSWALFVFLFMAKLPFQERKGGVCVFYPWFTVA